MVAVSDAAAVADAVLVAAPPAAAHDAEEVRGDESPSNYLSHALGRQQNYLMTRRAGNNII